MNSLQLRPESRKVIFNHIPNYREIGKWKIEARLYYFIEVMTQRHSRASQ